MLLASILYGNAAPTMASYFHLSLWLTGWDPGIQILAAPLTCSHRMIYAAMEQRWLLAATTSAAAGDTATATATCEKLSDISEFVGSHRLLRHRYGHWLWHDWKLESQESRSEAGCS